MRIILYIDPGTGSLLFQLLLSGIVSGLIFFNKVVLFFKKFFSKSDDNFHDGIIKNDKKK